MYNDKKILIRDDLKNFAKCAVLRWRLPDYKWKRKDNLFFSEFFDIEINSPCSDFTIKIKEGFTSMNYQLVENIKVLEISLSRETEVSTILRIKK